MVRTRQATRRASDIPGTSFLSLPAELRNQIYEYVAQDESTLSIRDGQVLYGPALGLVCRQVRKEYESIYLELAPQHSTKIGVHITDFDLTEVPHSIRQIESLEAVSTQRSYVVRVFVTNAWKLRDLRLLCAGSVLNQAYEKINYPRRNRPYDIEIHFDPDTFDVETCQEALLKLDLELEKVHRGWYLEDSNEDWPKVEKAFWDAFVRYSGSEDDDDSEGAGKKKRSKRQRVDGSSSRVKRPRR